MEAEGPQAELPAAGKSSKRPVTARMASSNRRLSDMAATVCSFGGETKVTAGTPAAISGYAKTYILFSVVPPMVWSPPVTEPPEAICGLR
jgi:hypothetical protein